MSFSEFSYDVKSFIKIVKDDIGGMPKVQVETIVNRPLAKSLPFDNPPKMELPTTPTIINHLGITEMEAVARSKVAVIEELCHIKYKEDHTKQVYSCVRSRTLKFLGPQEQKLVEGKMNRFCEEAHPSGCKLGVPISEDSLPPIVASEVT